MTIGVRCRQREKAGGYLQLAGLLIIAIAARKIESSAGLIKEHPLMILATLAGAATFAGATALRRYWKQAAVPPPDVSGEPEDIPTMDPALARERGGRAEDDFAPIDEETWRWRSAAGSGATDPRRAVVRGNDQGARVGMPR